MTHQQQQMHLNTRNKGKGEKTSTVWKPELVSLRKSRASDNVKEKKEARKGRAEGLKRTLPQSLPMP